MTRRRVPARHRLFFRPDGTPADLVDLFPGQAAFLIGNGPSFARVDPALLRQPGIFTMTMNNGGNRFRSNLWIAQDDPAGFAARIWHDPCIMKRSRASFSSSIPCTSGTG